MNLYNSHSARIFNLNTEISPPRTVQTARSPRRRPNKFADDNFNTQDLEFGKNGVHVTIGSSRKEEKPLSLSPGPAAYDTFDYVRTTPCFTLKSRPEVDYSTDTSRCDVPDLRQYPRKLDRKIGLRVNTDLWPTNDNPLAAYDIPAPSTPKVSIRSRIPIPVNDTPGPGQYSPRTPKTQYQATFPKLRTRNAFECRSVSPGPGQYNINRSLIRTEKWKGAIRPIKKWDYGEND